MTLANMLIIAKHALLWRRRAANVSIGSFLRGVMEADSWTRRQRYGAPLGSAEEKKKKNVRTE